MILNLGILAVLAYVSAGLDPRAYAVVFIFAGSELMSWAQPPQRAAPDSRWRLFVGSVAAAVLFGPLAYASWFGAGLLVRAVLATAAVTASLAMDHFGVLGSTRQPVTLLRAIGAVLMIAGLTFAFFPQR